MGGHNRVRNEVESGKKGGVGESVLRFPLISHYPILFNWK